MGTFLQPINKIFDHLHVEQRRDRTTKNTDQTKISHFWHLLSTYFSYQHCFVWVVAAR
jgi:hypothetical protein